MIGLSTGEQYEDATQWALTKHPDGGPITPQNKGSDDYDYAGAAAAGVKPDDRGHYPDTYKLPNHMTFSDESIHNKGGAGHWEEIEGKWSFTPGPENLKHHSMDELRDYFKKYEPDSQLIEPKQDAPNINRDHHVPLVASALTDDKGEMYGMAIDHRIPPRPEYEKHLYGHEEKENSYMNDLVKIGYTSQDAYHKAHDWSTARESAAVEAEFGKDGLEDYKQWWRDAATIAATPTDRDRHPDAHTTRHGLDESELGTKFAENEKPKEPGKDTPPPPSVWNWLQTDAPPGLLEHLIKSGQIKPPPKP